MRGGVRAAEAHNGFADCVDAESSRPRPDLPALPGHPVSGVARCWATSPVDHAVHLLACDGDDHPTGALLARCGALLATDVAQLDQPPPGPPCEHCRQLFVADFVTTRRLRPVAG